MNEDIHDGNPYGPKSGLHGLFVALFYVSLSLLALATVFVTLNWLDDFLHAPIGIKDYPPEPGIFVLVAKLAWIPLVLSVLLFGFLGIMSRVFKTIPLLLGTSIVAFGSISLVGGLLGEHEGEELFHGQAYFSQTVTPVLYVLFLMSWVGVGANHCIVKWKRDRKTRHGIAGLCLILGIMFGLVGLMGMTKGIESQIVFLMVGFLMALLGYVIYNVNYIVGKPE